MERSEPGLTGTFFLDNVGDVVLTLDDDGLSWKPLASDDRETRAYCLGIEFRDEKGDEMKISDVYAVEAIVRGPMNHSITSFRRFISNNSSEMYRFVVHGINGGRRRSPWTLSACTFGHPDPQTCQRWVDKINSCIRMQVGRPTNLLVFVHPLCGKGNGCRTWETVAPIFSRAKIKTKVIVTQRAGHAFHTMKSITNRELSSFDGIVVVGGDGLFNEVLNGLLLSRHKTNYPPGFSELVSPGNIYPLPDYGSTRNNICTVLSPDLSGLYSEMPHNNEDKPLLSSSESNCGRVTEFNSVSGPCHANEETEVLFPNNWFRLGIIPSGSTDAIVISTTGFRDPVTSALNIILGKQMSLDIAQVVRWKSNPSSTVQPSVRYAASFAGYGFYGDVVKESEKYRWMGPKRYDFAGTKVFLEHRSYEAEIAFLDPEGFGQCNGSSASESGTLQTHSLETPSRIVCRKDCIVCHESPPSCMLPTYVTANISSESISEDSKWKWSKGRFLSIGAAVISCRNERAPDGLVAEAHLSDGFLHLILIKDCPRPYYLWHLTKLTKRGSNPFNFRFVEHYKTRAFMFSCLHDEGVWNLDGELLQACQVSVQVCRGLVNLFASGPDI